MGILIFLVLGFGTFYVIKESSGFVFGLLGFVLFAFLATLGLYVFLAILIVVGVVPLTQGIIQGFREEWSKA